VFERVLDSVGGLRYNSYTRSIEHSFEARPEADMNTVVAITRQYERSQRAAVRRRPDRWASDPPLRLTRRGRILLAVCLIALFTAVSALAIWPSEATGRADSPDYTWVIVGPGETLWQLARDAAPGVDPRETIDRIIEMNSLTGANVQAGQRIAVPAER
jgi:hypothetical protein